MWYVSLYIKLNMSLFVSSGHSQLPQIVVTSFSEKSTNSTHGHHTNSISIHIL